MSTRLSGLILLALVSLAALLTLSACGGLIEMGIEPTPADMPPATLVGDEPVPTASASAPEELTPGPENQADPLEETVTITGTVAPLSSPNGWIKFLADEENPFTDADGLMSIQVGEWAGIRKLDGSVIARDELSKGARLVVTGRFLDESLVAEQVLVLEMGVPRPEENPAYTDVTGLVTPIAEPPPAEGAIRLFDFGGDDPILDPGAVAVLNWAFDGQSGAICQLVTPQPLTQTCYQDLLSSGSLEVIIPAEARGAIGFTLYVDTGDEVESDLIIMPLTAERGCDYEWSFSTSDLAFKPLLECPLTAPIPIGLQAQIFEKGLMVRLENSWLGAEAWLVALVPYDNDQYSLAFQPVLDEWTAGMPETDPDLTPPENLFQPSRGFGMLWRGEIEHHPMGETQTLDGPEVLGWATGRVFEFDTAYQCLESTHGRLGSCYMIGPEGKVIGLNDRP